MLVGRRIPADASGFIKANTMEIPGSYGKPTFDFVAKYGAGLARNGWWDIRCPDGSSCLIDPTIHTVTEHEDGTITLFPSLVTPTWHGWLEHGVWYELSESALRPSQKR